VLVLVDDGSTDDTFQVVASYSFAKQIIRGDGSLWFAGGVRRGMARVLAQNPRQDDVVWFANDDTSFESNFLENALRELDSIGQGAMLAVPSVFTDSGNRSEGGFCCYWPKFTFKDYGLHPERIDCASTRCLLMRWEDARKTGGFRPRLLPQYLSDLDFTIRGHRRGIRIIPAASVCSLSTEYTTGLHRVPPGKAWEVIKYMFSNRFSANPLHVFIFILLAAPVFWKVTCWLFAAKSSFSFFINATVVKRLRGRSGQGN
jgi:glycosyltransferase involved in cell wall biosynthesis